MLEDVQKPFAQMSFEVAVTNSFNMASPCTSLVNIASNADNMLSYWSEAPRDEHVRGAAGIVHGICPLSALVRARLVNREAGARSLQIRGFQTICAQLMPCDSSISRPIHLASNAESCYRIGQRRSLTSTYGMLLESSMASQRADAS